MRDIRENYFGEFVTKILYYITSAKLYSDNKFAIRSI